MQADSLPIDPPRSFVEFVGHGLVYGALAGIVSAEIYVVGLTVIAFIGGDPGALVGLFLGQIYGAVPAAIVGAVSGLVIGIAFFFLRNYLSAETGYLWGLFFALLLVGPVVLILAIPANPDPVPALAFGMPIIVLYLFSGAWGGHKLSGGTFRISSAQRKALLVSLGALGILVLARAAANLALFLINRK